MVRIVLILVFVVLQAVCGAPAWLMPDGAPYFVRTLGYSFFHANWLHLVVNCLAVWTVYDPKRRPCKPCTDLLFPFLIAVLVYPLSFRPVIGFSNVLYAVLGIRTPALSSTWWKQPTVVVFLVITLLMVFIPRFSATTHVAAFLLGMLVSSARRGWAKLTRDARRYY